jgi:hypothetical protein
MISFIETLNKKISMRDEQMFQSENKLRAVLTSVISNCSLSKGAVIRSDAQSDSVAEQVGFMQLNQHELLQLMRVFDNDGVNTISNVQHDERLVGFIDFFQKNQIQSFICAKVFDNGDDVLGWMILADTRPIGFTNQLLLDFARSNQRVAIALSHSEFPSNKNRVEHQTKKNSLPNSNNSLDQFVDDFKLQLQETMRQFEKAKTKLYEKNAFFWDQRDEKYFKELNEAQLALASLLNQSEDN